MYRQKTLDSLSFDQQSERDIHEVLNGEFSRGGTVRRIQKVLGLVGLVLLWGGCASTMMVFTDQQRLSLSEKDFVSAVSARLPIPKDPGDRKLLAALRALA